MKKISALFAFLVLFTAFTCENEPLEGEFQIENTMSCEEATQNTVTATTNFAGVSPSDANYIQLCIAYQNALQNLIDACGDTDGTIQAIVDSLGDCGDNNQSSECVAATTSANLAQNAYNGEPTNIDLCNAYKTALQVKIEACGDVNGSIQGIIDGLGDCTVTTPSIEISLTAGTLPIEFDLVDVVAEGNLLKVTGETSANNPYMVYFEVEEGATGMEVINGTFVLTLSTTDPYFYPSTQGFDDFTSTISENGIGTLIGSFGGIVSNSGGADLSLSQGVINILY